MSMVEVNIYLIAGQSNAEHLREPILERLSQGVEGLHEAVHVAGGGQPLAPLTDYPTKSWHPRVVGHLYDQLIGQTRDLLARLTGEQKSPVVRALFWMQGEQDAKSGNQAGGYRPPPQPGSAETWSANMAALVAALRRDLALPHLPVIMGQTVIGDDPRITHVRARHRTRLGESDYVEVVRAQQKACAAADPRIWLIETDTSMLGDDFIHLSQAGVDRLADGMVDAYNRTLTKGASVTAPHRSAHRAR